MNLGNYLYTSWSQRPDDVALVDEAGPTSYQELIRETARVSMKLIEAEVGPGDRVGLIVPKSRVAVAAMHACLWRGAAYVPVDPTGPLERAKAIFDDCRIKALIAPRKVADGLTERLNGHVSPLCLEDLAGPAVDDEQQIAPAHVAPDSLAYILYTSGSTGTPKGVSISHSNATAFVDWAVRETHLERSDRLANHAPFHFDLSVYDLYGAFCAGASVHLIPDGMAYAPGQLVRFVREREISVWYSVPSVLMLMMDDEAFAGPSSSSLRTVIFAGEPFPVPAVRRLQELLPSARLLNFYGPTETNVCTYHEVRAQDLADGSPGIPIGRPSSGDRVWVETSDGQQGLSPGLEGELWVAGPTVMLGYWGRPSQESRPYATGDLVRVLPDGTLLYVNRRDHMLKVRGHRVEPGEVERALLEHPRIREVAVVVRGAGPTAKLIAHVGGDDQVGLLELKRLCAERVPRHMIIHGVRHWKHLPRTRNGKIDRAALREPEPRQTRVGG